MRLRVVCEDRRTEVEGGWCVRIGGLRWREGGV